MRVKSDYEEPLLGLAEKLRLSAFTNPQIRDSIGSGKDETDFIYTGETIVSFIASTVEQDIPYIETSIFNWLKDFNLSSDALSIEEFSENQDWMIGFKEHFHPICVGDRIIVRPPWSDPLPHETPESTILIDPGMAFGTGTHETTRLCLTLLDEFTPKGIFFLDIGAGSGILSFYLMKQGANKGIAVEIEGAAVENMRKNAILNGMSDCLQMTCHDLIEFKPPELADGLVANITSPVIIDNIELMSRWVKKGAWGVFSGVNSANADSVKTTFATNNWKLEKEIIEDVWHAFKLVKI